jgi:hypothetical protein
MGLLKDDVRTKAGASLTTLKANATNAINRVIAIKSNVTSLKTTVDADVAGAGEYYTSADSTDIQSVLDYIETEVGKI